MGTEPFLVLGLGLAPVLLLITLVLIAKRKSTRPYLLFVMTGSLLAAIFYIGEGPPTNQVARFAVSFTVWWIVLAVLALIGAIAVRVAGTEKDDGQNDQAA